MAFDLSGSVTLIEVASVMRAIEFYRDVLGLEVYQSAGRDDYLWWAWLRRGDVGLMLNAMYEPGEEPGEPDPARIAAHRDTTIFIGCRDVDAAYAHLQAAGVSARPPVVTHYGMKQVSFHDPDGYGICLQWPTS